MLLEFWNSYLYEPVFNFLIWIYNNWADGNMGWAVIYLTATLRLALLPLTIISERNKAKNAEVEEEIGRLAKDFHYDRVAQKQEIRRRLRLRRVQPWAKALSLAVQALVFVLLYQVFISGITGQRMLKTLYSFVDFPGTINNIFYGFNLKAVHDIFWSGVVGIWLLVEIYIEFKSSKRDLRRGDLFYFIFFPLGVFIFLWMLPMVKSIFVLTSMVFSVAVHMLLKPFFSHKKAKKVEKKK
jgi:membrane protein insertase Oxa1/YidC/SpoIIIJ